MRQRHPERVTETTVDQLAEADLRLLGVPADEAARFAALPLPDTGTWNTGDDAADRIPGQQRRVGGSLRARGSQARGY